MKVGFIGLGVMGRPMAINLLHAGYELVVYDIMPDAMTPVKALGAETAVNCRDVARQSDIVVTMLPNSGHVKDAVLGLDGVLEGARSGTILIDMSSIAPSVAREIAQACARAGVAMLDAPVSGGESKAIDGTLTIMVGGKKDVFERAYDLFVILGETITLCGDIGAGNTTKLAHQILVAVNIAAIGEALVLGKLAGVAPEEIYACVRASLAGSTVLDAKTPMMMDGNFTPGFPVAQHVKDLANVVETAHAVGAPLPLTTSVMEMMQWLMHNGHSDEDHSALVKYYEYMAGTDIRR